MIDKFKKFLVKEFRSIAPTPEALQYREELLTLLIDKSVEYRNRGMDDEDAIYNLAIESLGDLQSTLIDFEKRREQLKQASKKIGVLAISIISSILLIVIGYLSISFATKRWDKTWLFLLGGIFTMIVFMLTVSIIKNYKKRRYLFTRVALACNITLVTVYLFLIFQMLTSLSKVYLAFLWMTATIICVDTVAAYITKSKTFKLEVPVAIIVSSVMLYVSLGLLQILKWSPGWLIILVGVLISVIYIGVMLFVSHKKNKKSIDKPTDEELYNHWEDR